MPADYHTHTPLCHHATGTPEAFVAAAAAAGLTELGISDHAPAAIEPFDDWRMLQRDLPAYLAWIERARAAAPPTLAVRAGLECDWLRGCQPWIETLRGAAAWDYLIGAVHYLDDWDFDNPKWLGRWAQADVEDVWSHYWRTYTEMAASGLFEILAHPDLVKKFAYQPSGDLRRFYLPAIEAAASSGATIELNTAGWHKPCAAPYPAPEFLALACQAGVPLVISSDAHAPGEVARDFAAAATLAAAAGYSHTATFHHGRRSGEPLVC
jgi:histidinol-phosphatase (PHP family)